MSTADTIPGPQATAVSIACDRFANGEIDEVELVDRLTEFGLDDRLTAFAFMAAVFARDERREAQS